MATSYQPLSNDQQPQQLTYGQQPQGNTSQYPGAGAQQYQPPGAGAPVMMGQPAGMMAAPYQQQQQYGGAPYGQPMGGPAVMYQQGANQTIVAVPMPNPGVAEVNMVWVAQQVDTTSCYIKILATLIVAYSIYALAISSASMYTSGWDIASGVFLLIVGILGLAAGITNRTNIARYYFWALIFLTVFLTIGYIIVLAVIGANPCKDVDDNSNGNKDANKICEYSVNTIRAVLVIAALIVIACCTCCTFCARMHLKNLELRDNNGVPRA